MIQDKIFFDEKDPTGLSYNTPFTYYGSYQGRLWSKSPTGSIKYYTQNSDLSVYATTGSNQFSGSQTVTGSLIVTGTITGTVAGTTATASYVEYTNVANKPALVSGSAQIASFGIFATTGSNGFNGSQSITGSLTVTGQVIAQTLNVQQVTSSIVYSSGSNVFGNSLANTQQFTGSVGVTGSLTVVGTGSFTGAVTIGNDVATALTYGRFSAGIPIAYLRASAASTGGFRLTNHNGADVIVVNGSNDITLDGATTITGNITYSSANNRNVTTTTGATTGYVFSNFTNSGNSLYWGLENSAGNGIGWTGGPLAYSAFFGSTDNRAVHIMSSSAVRLTVTGGGNVGIGTASPAAKLEIQEGHLRLYTNFALAGGGYAVIWASDAGGTNTSFATIEGVLTTDGVRKGDIKFNTSNSGAPTEKMRITSGGNMLLQNGAVIGLNTSDGSDTGYLAIAGASGDGANRGGHIYLSGNERVVDAGNLALAAGNISSGTGAPGAIVFRTGDSTERMRVTPGGTVQVGGWGTGTDVSLRINGNSNGQVAFFDHNGQLYVPFLDTSTGTDLVLTSGGFINKKSSSIRYKENITPIDIGLDFIMSLNPVKFNMKSDGLAQVGFVAEEFPDERLVSFSQIDIEDASKGLQRESINYAQITAPLVKAIQELSAKIEILEAKIQTLEQQ